MQAQVTALMPTYPTGHSVTTMTHAPPNQPARQACVVAQALSYATVLGHAKVQASAPQKQVPASTPAWRMVQPATMVTVAQSMTPATPGHVLPGYPTHAIHQAHAKPSDSVTPTQGNAVTQHFLTELHVRVVTCVPKTNNA